MSVGELGHSITVVEQGNGTLKTVAGSNPFCTSPYSPLWRLGGDSPGIGGKALQILKATEGLCYRGFVLPRL